MNWDSFLLSLLTSLMAAILTAFFSFWVFHSKRWWELKAQTYSKVIEALHYIKKCDEYRYARYEEQNRSFSSDEEYHEYMRQQSGKESSKEVNAETEKSDLLEKRREEALQEIAKIIDVSSYILDQPVQDELKKITDDYVVDFHYVEDIDYQVTENRKLVEGCLLAVKRIAKNDLETMPSKLISKFEGFLKGFQKKNNL